MSDCCGSTKSENRVNEKSLPRKVTCPINKQQYIEVSKKTIFQHIKHPWKYSLQEEKYYFCDDINCDVVYFGLQGSIINKQELRALIGKKEQSEETLVCYCFGITKKQANEDKNIKQYVTQQTKENNCACEVRNPSGRCCLKDFTKQIQ